jgi:hypothetical protein
MKNILNLKIKRLEAFFRLTGVPMVLNTSFNENEPVVCRPNEALDCFLRTKMDLLVLGNHVAINVDRPLLQPRVWQMSLRALTLQQTRLAYRPPGEIISAILSLRLVPLAG